jgi:hypothetical protein
MKGIGYALAIFGVLACVVALLMTTSVETPASYSGLVYTGSSSVINIGLLQNQQLAFSAGLAMFVAGCIVASLGHVVDAFRDGRVGSAISPLSEAPDDALRPARQYDEAASNKADQLSFKIAIGLAIVFALVMGFSWLGGKSAKTAEAVAIEANADMLADNMEMEADNLDAAADATGRISR